MKLSAFTRCGHLSMSGRKPVAEQYYRQLIANYGPTYFPAGVAVQGTYMEAKVYATAMALARAKLALVRAGNQRHPATCWDMILDKAKDFGVIPSATDTLPSLQKKIIAAQLLTRGARLEAIVAGLHSILGSDFLAYRTFLPSEVTSYPTWPSTDATLKSSPRLPGLLRKACVLVDPVGKTGSSVTVTYDNLDTTEAEQDLAAGDVVVVEGGNTAISEVVTVTATSGSGVEKNPPVLAYWTSSAAHVIGDLVEPVPANGYAYICTANGTTGGAEPTWPTTPNLSVVDGTATWTCTGTRYVGAFADVALPMIWTPSMRVAEGVLVQRSLGGNLLYFACTTSGVTAASEPTWPTMQGATVQDGSVVWTCRGFVGATRTFTATFQYAHDVGATVSTMSWPFQWSTQRYALIIVSSADSVDSEARRQVNEFMAKAARGVSTWSIVEPTSLSGAGGSVGPFTVGSSPIGATPIGSFTFTDTP